MTVVPLDETITDGQAGHLADHMRIHDYLNDWIFTDSTRQFQPSDFATPDDLALLAPLSDPTFLGVATFNDVTVTGISELADVTVSGDLTVTGTITGDVDATQLTGIVPAANLGTGASGTNFLRSDGTWATPAGGGGGTGDMLKTENLSGLANYTTARTNLNVDVAGTAATLIATHAAAADPHADRAYTDTQISGLSSVYQAKDTDLTTLAGLTATTNNFIVSVASAWASRTPTQVRDLLDLEIGTDVQAYNANLTTWAAKTVPAGTVVGTTDTQTLTNKSIVATQLTGTIATARLGSGTADTTTFLRGDNTWAAPAGAGDALTTNPLSQFAATTSLELKGVISDETGSGALVFATSPTIVTPTIASFTNATHNHSNAAGGGTIAASVVTVVSTTLVGTGTDVQAVFEELDNAIVANETAVADHIADTSAAHAASAVSYAGGTGIVATNVEGALDELADEKQNADAALTTLAGLTATTNNFIVSVSSAWASRTPAQVKTTLAIANTDVSGLGTMSTQSAGAVAITGGTIAGTTIAATQLTGTIDNARLGTTGTRDSTTFLRGDNVWAAPTAGGGGDLLAANNLSDLASTTTARDNLGVEIGADVQAWDAALDDFAGLTQATNTLPYFDSATTMATLDFTTVGRALAAAADAAAGRTAIGAVIGTNVQAQSAALDTLAGLTATTNNFIVSVASAWASRTPAQVKTTLAIANTDVSGLGTMSTQAASAVAITGGTIAGTTIAATQLTGTVATARLGSGTADSTTFLRGDGTWAVPSGAGDAELVAIAGLTSAADTIPYFTGSGTAALATFTAFGRSLVDDANAAAAIATLGLDADIATFVVPASTTISTFGASLIDDAAASNARTTLGLVIGTDVQAQSAVLDDLAGLTQATDKLPYFNAATTAATTDLTAFGRSLIDDANAAAALTTLTLDADLATFVVPASTTISAFGATLVDDADAAAGRTTLNVDVAGTAASLIATHAAAADPHADRAYTDTQISGLSSVYQPLDADLTALAGLTSAADKLPYFTGTGTASVSTFTTFGRSLVDDANAAAAIATLGLDADLATFSVPASTTISTFGATIIDDANAAAVLTTLGLDADLATFVVPASTTISTFGASLIDDTNTAGILGTLALDLDLATFSLPASTTISTYGASLVDDADASTARTTLGLTGMSTATTTAAGDLTGTWPTLTVAKINGVAYNADPLVQYAALAGRSGGTTIIGGTVAADDLTFRATSGSTPTGDIYFKGGTGGATTFGRIGSDGKFEWNGWSEITGPIFIENSTNAAGCIVITEYTTVPAGIDMRSTKGVKGVNYAQHETGDVIAIIRVGASTNTSLIDAADFRCVAREDLTATEAGTEWQIRTTPLGVNATGNHVLALSVNNDEVTVTGDLVVDGNVFAGGANGFTIFGEFFQLDSNGNLTANDVVVAGDATVGGDLTVTGTATGVLSTNYLNILPTDGYGSGIIPIRGYATNPTFLFQQSGGTSAAPTVGELSSAGNWLGVLQYQGCSAVTPIAFVNGAIFRAVAEQDITPTHGGTRFEWLTAANDSTTPVLRAAIDNAGTFHIAPEITGAVITASEASIDKLGNMVLSGTLSHAGQHTYADTASTNTASRVEFETSTTQTFSTTASMQHYVMRHNATDLWTVTPNTSGMFIGWQNFGIFSNSPASNVNLSPIITFYAGYNKRVDTQTGLAFSTDTDFNSAPSYTAANSGTFTSATHQSFAAGVVLNAAACTMTAHNGVVSNMTVTAGTLTTGTHVNIKDATGAGTLTTQVGIDIAALAKGGTNIGIRNKASTVLGSTGQCTVDTSGNIVTSGTLTAGATTVTTLAMSGALTGATIATSQLSGIVPLANLGLSGTPSATTFLRGDNTWAVPAGGGGDAELDAIAGLTSAADRVPYFTGSGTAALATFTTFGRSLVDDANAAAGIATLGLDADLATFSVPASTTISAFGATFIDDADAAAVRTTLGLGTISTQNANAVQITGGNVTALSALSTTGDFLVNTNKFTVDAATGNTLVAGTLSITGTSNGVAKDIVWGAAGDVLIGTGSDAGTRLAVSTTAGQALRADPNATNKISYGNPLSTAEALSGTTGCKAATYDRRVIPNTAAGGAATSGTLSLYAIPLPKGLTVTTLTFWAGTTAGASLTNSWAAFFDSSRNLLAISADDTSSAWTASALRAFTMTTPYVIPADGFYYVGLCVVGTTIPTIEGAGAAIQVTGARNAAPKCSGRSTVSLTNPASCTTPATALTSMAQLAYCEIT